MKNDNGRKVPLKNYIILGVILVITLLILYYFYRWVDVYKESKINYSILDRYMTVINYNEFNDYLVENPDVVVYVSVLENDEIRDFEKKLKGRFKRNEIDNDILYMEITNEVKDKTISEEIYNKYALNNLSMLSVPCVLVFNSGELSSIYSISDNNYDVDNLIIYLNNILLDGDDV